MSDTPLVSVVVPTYRRPQYLREAIASVVAQQEGAWEMLVCDDGADDRNREVVETFADPRIVYRRNPERLGIGANKFTGWQAATGRYVANLDDDDVWEPEFLSTLVPLLEADPTLTIAFSSHHVINAEGRIDERETERTEALYRSGLVPGRHEPFARLALVDQAIPVTMASVIRRAAVDWHDFAPDTDVVADYWLAYLIAREPGGAYYCPRRLTRYRVHEESCHRHDSRLERFLRSLLPAAPGRRADEGHARRLPGATRRRRAPSGGGTGSGRADGRRPALEPAGAGRSGRCAHGRDRGADAYRRFGAEGGTTVALRAPPGGPLIRRCFQGSTGSSWRAPTPPRASLPDDCFRARLRDLRGRGLAAR